MQDLFRKGWTQDNLGVQSPLGSSIGAKELQQLPSEMQKLALAANTLIRGNFSKDLWPDLSMANTLAPRHRPTQVFLASITAGSMAEDGAASKKFLMGITNMLAPGMLEEAATRNLRDRTKNRKNHTGKVAEDDE